MKIFSVILLCAVIFVSISCSCPEPETQIVYVQQPQVEQPQTKAPTQDPPGTYKGEVIPQEIKEGSSAELYHKDKIDFSQSKTEIVPEPAKPPVVAPDGKLAKVYMRVEVKYFDNKDMLKQMRTAIIEGAQNKHYEIEEESRKDLGVKGFSLKLWSQLPGPMSLTETLDSILSDYSGKYTITRKNENLVVITPSH